MPNKLVLNSSSYKTKTIIKLKMEKTKVGEKKPKFVLVTQTEMFQTFIHM